MRKGFITLFAVGCAALLGAAELQRLVCSEPADFRGPKLEKQEDGSLLLTRGSVRSVKSIKVDPTKSCRLTLQYKLLSDSEPIGLVVAVNSLTNGRPIGGMTVAAAKETLTELAEPVEKGAKSFKVKDVSGWAKATAGRKNMCVAFNAKEDLSDLPNLFCSGLIAGFTPEGEVTLRNGKIARDYPAGTKVRLHYDYESFGIGTLYLKAGNEWKSAMITVKPAVPGEFNYARSVWWPKVNAAGVHLMLRGKIPADGGVLFRNIVLEELAE